MKTVDRIIAKMLARATKEEIYSDSSDGGQSSFGLCDVCEKLGFCRVRRGFKLTEDEVRLVYRMEDSDIMSLIPLRAEWELFDYYGPPHSFTNRHLQTAFAALHQQDFETAILNCMAVLGKNTCNGIANTCMAVSYYYLGKYTEAMDYANQSKRAYYGIENEKLEEFIWHCENVLKEKQKGEVKVVEESKEVLVEVD